jgi:ABC-type lipoprotein export system ATPase subunit
MEPIQAIASSSSHILYKCLDCGNEYVRVNFCPKCGSEDLSLSITFGHLVFHTIADAVCSTITFEGSNSGVLHECPHPELLQNFDPDQVLKVIRPEVVKKAGDAVLTKLGDKLDEYLLFYIKEYDFLNKVNPVLSISEVLVQGLFGLHTFKVDFRHPDRVSVLLGPNGIGKTTILRMIKGMLSGDFEIFEKVPFASFCLTIWNGFSDQFTMDIKKGKDGLLINGFDFLNKSIVIGQGPTHDFRLLKISLMNIFKEFWRPMPGAVLISANRYSNVSRIQTNEEPVIVNRKYKDEQKIKKAVLDNDPAAEGSSFELQSDLLKKTQKFADDYFQFFQGIDLDDPAYKEILEKAVLPYDFVPEFLLGYPESVRSDLVLAKRGYSGLSKETADQLGEYTDSFEHYLGAVEPLARTSIALSKLSKHFEDMTTGNAKKKVIVSPEGLISFKALNGDVVKLSQLSSGELNFFVLCYQLYVQPVADDVVLIDEPEVSLNIQIQSTLVPMMKEASKLNNYQIICVTHSPFVGSGNDEVYSPIQYQSKILKWN